MTEVLDKWDFYRRGAVLLGVAEAKSEHAFSALMLRLERSQPGFPQWRKLLARPTEQDTECPWVVDFGEPGDFFWTLNRGLWREFPEAPEPSEMPVSNGTKPTERAFQLGTGEWVPVPTSKGAKQMSLMGGEDVPAEDFTKEGRLRKKNRKEKPHA